MNIGSADNTPASPQAAEAAVRIVVGLGLYADGQVAAATDVLRRATELAPHYPAAHLAYAQMLLAQGQFLAGWPEFAWRKYYNPTTKTIVENIGAPEWTGEDLRGQRLLVVCDEGLGDAIMFARYLPRVADRVGNIVVGWGPEHSSIFKPMDCVSRVFSSVPDRSEFDAYVMICDLPNIFATTLETIPAQIPYLPLDERKKHAWRTRLERDLPNSRLRVGLTWAGSLRYARDAQRSLDFTQLAPVLEIENISYIALQKVVREQDRIPLENAPNVLDVSASLEGFDDTAALIANLDFVISVDSAVAHLAGAIGAPVWVLLPKPSDWRWLLDRSDTPWYPTMRLIRQQRYNDWNSVLKETERELRRLSA